MTGARLIVGNLDCELDFSRSAGADPSPLPTVVDRMLSAAATTMAVFGGPGEQLWTPQPINPARLVDCDLRLTTGNWPTRATILAWGETAAVAAARTPEPKAEPGPGTWLALLWAVHPSAETATRCNHRRFAFELNRSRNATLPNTTLLRSFQGLIDHLAAGAADPGHQRAWVIKAPHSASGRTRLRRRGTELDDAAETRARRLFDRHGQLLFEPWVDRLVDFGRCGIATASGYSLLELHRLETDAAGVFRGISIADPDVATWLEPAEREAIAGAANAAGAALSAAGYRGPFSVDSYVYRDSDGVRHVQPMSEINARMSFGHVARAWAERFGAKRCCFRLDRGPVPEAKPGHRLHPILLPGEADPTSAWLEAAVESSPAGP